MSLHITEDEARKLGIPAAGRRRRAVVKDCLTPDATLKPPAPSRDTRRPWLDTILHRVRFKGDLGPEDRVSGRLAGMLIEADREGRSRCVWTHVPNEGKRGRAYLAKLIHIGMVPSSPDFWFAWSTGAGVIELTHQSVI